MNVAGAVTTKFKVQLRNPKQSIGIAIKGMQLHKSLISTYSKPDYLASARCRRINTTTMRTNTLKALKYRINSSLNFAAAVAIAKLSE